MSNQGKVGSAARLNEVIFRDTAHAPALKKFTSLFPGLGYAAGYKVPLPLLPLAQYSYALLIPLPDPPENL